MNLIPSEIPMFIQVQQRWRRLFFGICMGNGFHASYQMAHLKSTPPQCQNISGLLDVFKAKLVSYEALKILLASLIYLKVHRPLPPSLWRLARNSSSSPPVRDPQHFPKFSTITACAWCSFITLRLNFPLWSSLYILYHHLIRYLQGGVHVQVFLMNNSVSIFSKM